jgi:hypothetical protein
MSGCAGLIRNMTTSTVAVELARRELSEGGWSFTGSAQASIEATSLAGLALANINATRAGQFLLHTQRRDGAWPAFLSDPEASWTTALVVPALTVLNDSSSARERAVAWILNTRGREGHWLWRWKFKTSDRQVHFDPDRFGWPWILGANSWVIPTAFTLVALKQFTACARSTLADGRIRTGIDMLLDRACLGGGWNAGNSMVYGVPLAAHVEPTAIALLALQDGPRTELVRQSVAWLKARAAELQSVSSLAWAILALFMYQERIHELKERLSGLVGDGARIRNNATLAVAVLALRCGEEIHPFAVLR